MQTYTCHYLGLSRFALSIFDVQEMLPHFYFFLALVASGTAQPPKVERATATCTTPSAPQYIARQYLTLKVKEYTTFTEAQFKIKPTTPLWKLTNAFCRRFGFDANMVVFLVDGDPLRHIDTALSLGLEDGDYIDMCGPGSHPM